jgi:acyl carrier protein
MNRGEIRNVVLECILEVVGDRSIPEITDRTDPIRELGLDSEDGVAIACALAERFECPIPDSLNPIVDDARHRGRRVSEIIALVETLLTAQDS